MKPNVTHNRDDSEKITKPQPDIFALKLRATIIAATIPVKVADHCNISSVGMTTPNMLYGYLSIDGFE